MFPPTQLYYSQPKLAPLPHSGKQDHSLHLVTCAPESWVRVLLTLY